MSQWLYWLLCVPAFAVGVAIGARPFGALVPLGLWLLGTLLAAALGAFKETSEDTSFGLVFFFVTGTAVWVACALVGVLVRRLLERRWGPLPRR